MTTKKDIMTEINEEETTSLSNFSVKLKRNPTFL